MSKGVPLAAAGVRSDYRWWLFGGKPVLQPVDIRAIAGTYRPVPPFYRFTHWLAAEMTFAEQQT